MTGRDGTMVLAVHEAVQSYVDALLAPDTGDAPPSALQGRSADGASAYRVVRVSSVRLALPESMLHAPLPLPPLLAYSAADWLLGRYHHEGRQLHVVDLARVAAPEVPRAQPEMMIPVRDRPWALACTLDDAPLILARRSVRWREPSKLRPWLAGMSLDGTCAVLDITALLTVLEQDPRFHPEPPAP